VPFWWCPMHLNQCSYL